MEENMQDNANETTQTEQSNSTEQRQEQEEKKHICFKNHCWKMCLGMIIAAFIGGFLASYFVIDQIMERSAHKYYAVPPHIIEQKMFNDMERDFRDNMRDIEKIMQKTHRPPIPKKPGIGISPIFTDQNIKVKSEFEDGIFSVSVNLKPFQGDEDKISYSVHGRKLTIFGKSVITKENGSEEIAFSQDFLLPDGADILNIKKYKDGKKLIISIPVRE